MSRPAPSFALHRAAGRDQRARRKRSRTRAHADSAPTFRRAPLRAALRATRGGELAVTPHRRSTSGRPHRRQPPGAGDSTWCATTSRRRPRGRCVFSNPGDEPVAIPAHRLQSRCDAHAPAKPRAGDAIPAVILLGGSGCGDRDGLGLGVPTLGQLAGALATPASSPSATTSAGIGQSGGRSESATFSDYAEDVRDRRAVAAAAQGRRPRTHRHRRPQRRRLGGSARGVAREAVRAAWRRSRRRSTTGAELVLEQQRDALDQTKIAPEDRDAEIALQKRIQRRGHHRQGLGRASRGGQQAGRHAVVPEPAGIRPGAGDQKRATAAAVRPRRARSTGAGGARRSPLRTGAQRERLEVDRGGDRSAASITCSFRRSPVEVSEYASLTDRNVSSDVSAAITAWLTTTFAAIK